MGLSDDDGAIGGNGSGVGIITAEGAEVGHRLALGMNRDGSGGEEEGKKEQFHEVFKLVYIFYIHFIGQIDWPLRHINIIKRGICLNLGMSGPSGVVGRVGTASRHSFRG